MFGTGVYCSTGAYAGPLNENDLKGEIVPQLKDPPCKRGPDELRGGGFNHLLVFPPMPSHPSRFKSLSSRSNDSR